MEVRRKEGREKVREAETEMLILWRNSLELSQSAFMDHSNVPLQVSGVYVQIREAHKRDGWDIGVHTSKSRRMGDRVLSSLLLRRYWIKNTKISKTHVHVCVLWWLTQKTSNQGQQALEPTPRWHPGFVRDEQNKELKKLYYSRGYSRFPISRVSGFFEGQTRKCGKNDVTGRGLGDSGEKGRRWGSQWGKMLNS